jgi:hypothetical protein
MKLVVIRADEIQPGNVVVGPTSPSERVVRETGTNSLGEVTLIDEHGERIWRGAPMARITVKADDYEF